MKEELLKQNETNKKGKDEFFRWSNKLRVYTIEHLKLRNNHFYVTTKTINKKYFKGVKWSNMCFINHLIQ